MAKPKKNSEKDSLKALTEEAALLGQLSASATELFDALIDEGDVDAAAVIAELACAHETNLTGSSRTWREILKQTNELLLDENETEEEDDEDEDE